MLGEPVIYSVKITISSGEHALELLGAWGEWKLSDKNILPTNIPQNTTKEFLIYSHEKAGIWFRVINPTSKQEVGFTNMSFVSPRLSSNGAEGSYEEDLFINAGLQKYLESGSELEINYKVGESNLADWGNGNHYSKDISCAQTMFEDARAFIEIENKQSLLQFTDYWNDNNNGVTNWYWEPTQLDIPTQNCKRTIVLKDNDHAGLFLKHLDTQTKNEVGYTNLTFSCPRSSHNCAEGTNTENDSDFKYISAGLQNYDKSGTPVTYKYIIGEENIACWHEANLNTGELLCPQTKFTSVSQMYK